VGKDEQVQVHLTGSPVKILSASPFFSGQLHQFHDNILDFPEPLPLAGQEMINFPVELVDFDFRMDAYLVIVSGMVPVSNFLPDSRPDSRFFKCSSHQHHAIVLNPS